MHAGADPLALLTERDYTARHALGVIADHVEERAAADRDDLALRIVNYQIEAHNRAAEGG